MSRQDKKRSSPRKEPRDISPDTIKRVTLLIANTVILTFIYFGTMGLNQPVLSFIVTAGYWAVFGCFLIVYIIYNRGFTRKGITEEMLPDGWGDEKKAEYIADGAKRQQNSKWMLSVIIPLMIPIAFDAIALFTWPIIQNLFNFK